MRNIATSNVLISITMAIYITGCLAMEKANLHMPPAPPYQATIQTFFLPQSQEYVYERLTFLLNSAKNQILIAMYWLTDDVILNKLFELKARGIDIQIILDGSLDKTSELINKLIRYNIVPIVLPKGTGGIMHNKYVVVDNTAVWTGSGNFTKVVLSPESAFINDENIVIIDSPVAAEQYRNAFYFTQNEVLGTLISTLAGTDSRDLPDWLIPLCKELSRSNRVFKDLLRTPMPQFTFPQQVKLHSLFPEYSPYPYIPKYIWGEEATPKQKAFLEIRGINPNISKQEASKLIGDIMASEGYNPY